MYDLTYIANPNLNEDELIKLKEKVRNFISGEGTISEEKPETKRKLAYPIKKTQYGFYVTIVFDIEPNKLDKIEKALKSEKSILRYLIIKKDKSQTVAMAIPEKIKKKQKRIVEKVKIEELDKKLEELLQE